MLRSLVHGVAAVAALAGTAGAQAGPSSDLARQVFAAESSFAATMAHRDIEAFAGFLAPEAVFFGRAPIRGKAAVVEAWRAFFDGPDDPFSWRPETVEVLPSGTLALTSAPVFDTEGKRTTTFTTIWRLEDDGRWRVVFDKGCPIGD